MDFKNSKNFITTSLINYPHLYIALYCFLACIAEIGNWGTLFLKCMEIWIEILKYTSLTEWNTLYFWDLLLVLERAHFLSSSSFIEFQTVKFEHVLSSTFAWVFRVLARAIRVFQVFLSSSLVEFKFWGIKLFEFSSFQVARSSTTIQCTVCPRT